MAKRKGERLGLYGQLLVLGGDPRARRAAARWPPGRGNRTL